MVRSPGRSLSDLAGGSSRARTESRCFPAQPRRPLDDGRGALRTEELGFDHVAVGNRLLDSGFGLGTDPLVLLSAAAGAAGRLRPLTSVRVAPYYPALLLAHQAAPLRRASPTSWDCSPKRGSPPAPCGCPSRPGTSGRPWNGSRPRSCRGSPDLGTPTAAGADLPPRRMCRRSGRRAFRVDVRQPVAVRREFVRNVSNVRNEHDEQGDAREDRGTGDR
ncbi:LLM class flavin-dependent oxidoreductase [Streptomyces sp. G1]|uniref:LLM class flavin-dependent oxidoreductase n=1 Tax=Streptomyces sp. G1 TaxID=361572 RepID=UPI0035AC05E4